MVFLDVLLKTQVSKIPHFHRGLYSILAKARQVSVWQLKQEADPSFMSSIDCSCFAAIQIKYLDRAIEEANGNLIV